ncbi:efflux RND transporter periplasmic adaptor subunit [Cupriavidus sp. H39]|uniref:efflux RND transporter periplasmic adaptor subunit n=1 Tax=Cupriavidus sp. H39 TaxID=3401635 RepID=UPI003CFE39CF
MHSCLTKGLSRYRAARFVLLVAVGSLLPAACKHAEEPTAPEVRPVRTIKIEQRAATSTVTLTGTVHAQSEISLSFRIDGRMTERRVKVGDTVKPGQLVARLDPQNEQSSLQGANAQLVAATAQQIEARSSYARLRDLVAKRAVSQAQYEQAEAVMKSADAAVAVARSQVTLATNRLTYTRLVSDSAGVVTSVGAESGEVVRAGQKIVEIAREGGRDAVFDFPAAVKESMPEKPEFTVSLTMNPKVEAAARVREVSPRADPVTGTFQFRLRLIDPPPAMRLGSTVTARMSRGAAEGYVIPASALVRSDRRSAVWVVDPKALTVAQQVVEVSDFDPGWVIATGVKPGDIVVTAGVQVLRPGQKVRLLETRQ